MQHNLLKFVKFANALNERVGKATSWLLALLVVLVCFDVVARKLFNFSKIWMMEMEWHLYSLVFLLAAGYALKHDRHVRVDLFYEKYGLKDKALTNFWGHLIFLIPWCVMVIFSSYHYAMESYSMNEGSPEPGGLPARYIIKFAITIGATLLLLQAIAGMIESGFVLFGKNGNNELGSSKENSTLKNT
ncbi:MAG: TRAP transporter small permease subunit [Bacteroidota bacterium]